MQAQEAHQLAADILGELAAFNRQPHIASWPDSLWPEVSATAQSIHQGGENEAAGPSELER